VDAVDICTGAVTPPALAVLFGTLIGSPRIGALGKLILRDHGRGQRIIVRALQSHLIAAQIRGLDRSVCRDKEFSWMREDRQWPRLTRWSCCALFHPRHCEPTGRATARDDRLREANHRMACAEAWIASAFAKASADKSLLQRKTALQFCRELLGRKWVSFRSATSRRSEPAMTGANSAVSSPAHAGDPVFQRGWCLNREAAAYWMARLRGP